jgi:hypothetical protein
VTRRRARRVPPASPVAQDEDALRDKVLSDAPSPLGALHADWHVARIGSGLVLYVLWGPDAATMRAAARNAERAGWLQAELGMDAEESDDIEGMVDDLVSLETVEELRRVFEGMPPRRVQWPRPTCDELRPAIQWGVYARHRAAQIRRTARR